MVSHLAATLLSKYLGEYLDDLNKDNVKLSFLSGEAELYDVKIKQTALQRLFPSVVVKQAVVRKLSLFIPWNQIKTKPAIIKLDGIYVLAEASKDVDEQYYKDKFHQEKLQRVLVQELIRIKHRSHQGINDWWDEDLAASANSSSSSSSSSSVMSSFGGKMLATVVDNLQLYINSVHIRFEGTSSNPFAVGITMKKLIAESTDSNWKPTFLQNKDNNSIVHKVINLSDLSVYWDSDKQHLKYTSLSDLVTQLEYMITEAGSEPSSASTRLSYVLPPFSSSLRAVFNKSIIPSDTVPRLSLSLRMDDTNLSVSDAQYQDITNVMEGFTMFRKSIENRMHAKRPHSSLSASKASTATGAGVTKQNARQWWKYAIDCVVGKIHQDKYQHTWSYLFDFLRDKKEYIKLYKKLKSKTIQPAEKEKLDALEWKLPFENIILFRNLCYRMLETEDKKKKLKAKEKEKEKEKSKEKPKVDSPTTTNQPSTTTTATATTVSAQQPQQSQQQAGWFSTWWKAKPIDQPNSSSPSTSSPTTSTTLPSFTTSNSSNSNNNNNNEIQLTKQEWAEIYDTIGFQEEDKTSAAGKSSLQQSSEGTNNVVKTVIQVSFSKVSLTLKKNSGVLAILQLLNLQFDLKAKESSYQFDCLLEKLDLIDHSTPNTYFPKLITPCLKDSSSSSSTSPTTTTTAVTAVTSTTNSTNDNILFKATFKSHRVGEPCDYSLNIQSKPLTIVYYPLFVSTISNFFISNSNSIDIYEDIERMASTTINSIKSQTKDRLLMAISNQTRLSLSMELEAPIIVIPDDIHNNDRSNMIILDLGHLSINHTPTKINNNNNNNNSEQQPSEKWEEFYDEYLFKLTNIRLLLSRQDRDWKDQSQVQKYRMNIASPFDANLSLNISKVRNHLLTSLKLFINIKLLELCLSSLQYVDMIHVIQSITSSQKQQQQQQQQQQQIATHQSSKNELLEMDLTNILEDKYKSIIENLTYLESIFQVENFNIHLRMSGKQQVGGDSSSTIEENLALIYLRRCRGVLTQRHYDSSMVISVKALWIEDCLKKPAGNGNYLALTTNHLTLQSIQSMPDEKLVNLNGMSVKIIQTSSSSPNYRFVDQEYEISLPQLNLILNKNTVAGVIEFSNSVSQLTSEKIRLSKTNESNSTPTPTTPPTFNNTNNLNKSTSNNNISTNSPTLKQQQQQQQKQPLIKLRLSFKIGLVRVLLTNETNSPLIKLALTELVATTDMYLDTTQVYGRVGSIKIYDMTLEGRNYRTIFTTKERRIVNDQNSNNNNNNSGGESFSPNIVDDMMGIDTNMDVNNSTLSLLSLSSTSSMVAEDEQHALIHFQLEQSGDGGVQRLKCRLSSIRFVFLKRFIEQVRIFLSSVNVMREYLKQSIYSAASVISQNRSTFLYEIQVDNPYIIVPLSSLSHQVFIADLGRIVISNTIKEDPEDPNVIIESIQVDGTNLKLLSGLDIKSSGLNVRSPPPSTLSPLSASRKFGKMAKDINISCTFVTPFYQTQPESVTDGAIHLPPYQRSFVMNPIELLISEYETKCLIELLDGNLSEYSSSIQDDLAGDTTVMGSKLNNEDNNNNKENSPTQVSSIDGGSSSEEKEVRLVQSGTTNVLLDKFSIIFMKRDGSIEQDRLVQFIATNASMHINTQEMETNLSIEVDTIFLNDYNRQTHPHFKSLFSPLTGGSGDIKMARQQQLIIRGTIRPPPIQQSVFQMELNSMSMVFVPHSWLEVQSCIGRLVTFGMDAWLRYSTKILGAAPVGVDEVIQSGSSFFSAHIQDARIALPTNTRLDGDGDGEYALVIRATVDVQNTTKGAVGVESVSLIEADNVQVYRHKLNNHQKDIARKIVEPFKAVYQITQTPKSHEVNLSVDQITINFSYLDFKQIMLISSTTITSFPTEGSEIIPIKEDDDQQEYEQLSSLQQQSNQPIQKYFQVKLGKGNFILHDDHLIKETIPLLSITVDRCKSDIFSWTLKQQVAFSLESNINSNYFNGNNGVWEPLVEAWGFTITANNSAEEGWISDFSSKIPLQINITKGFVDTSLSTYQILTADFYKSTDKNDGGDEKPQSSDDLVSSPSSSSPSVASPKISSISEKITKDDDDEDNQYYPYFVRNDTGQLIWYWLDNNQLIEVPIGAEVPLVPDDLKQLSEGGNHLRGLGSKGMEVERKISFQLYGNFKPIKNVPMDTIGTYTLHPMPEYRNVKLLYDISYRKGSKVLSLHSNIVIANNTNQPMVVHVGVGANKEIEPTEIHIDANSRVPLPILYSMGRLRIKPNNMGYSLSNEQIDCITVLQMIKQQNQQNQTPPNSSPTFGSKQPTPPSSISNNNNNESNIISSRMNCKHTAKLPYSIFASIEKKLKENRIEISIQTPIIIENVLACDLSFRLYHAQNKKIIGSPFLTGTIKMGERLEVATYDSTLEIYMEMQIYDFPWSQPFLIEGGSHNPTEKIKIMDKNKQPLLISFDNRVNPSGNRYINIYCEFWMINQTGLPLYYRHHIGAQTIEPAGQDQETVIPPHLFAKDSLDWYQKNDEWAHPTPPFMFAYSDSNLVGGRFALKISNSEWSSPFSLNSSSSSASSNITIKEEKTSEEKKLEIMLKPIPEKRYYQLAVSCLPSNSKFWRTRVVTFCPEHIIVNTTAEPIYYQQFECYGNTQTILPNQSLPFYFPSSKREKLIRIGSIVQDPQPLLQLQPQSQSTTSNNQQQQNIRWSGYFNPDELGNIIVRLRRDADTQVDKNRKDSEISKSPNFHQQQPQRPKHFMSVTIGVKATKTITTKMIMLGEHNPDLPPYRIDNHSRVPIWIRQKKTENWEQVKAHSSIPYTWDHFILPKKLCIEFPGGEKNYYRLNDLEENSTVHIKEKDLALIQLQQQQLDNQISNSSSNSSSNLNLSNTSSTSSNTGTTPFSSILSQPKIDLEITITACGPTRVLNLREKPRQKTGGSPTMSRDKTNDLALSDDNNLLTEEKLSSQYNQKTKEYEKFETRVKLVHIGLSIVNQVPEEIIYASFDRLSVDFKQTKTDQYLEISLDDLQIDDQRYQSNFPVFLSQSKRLDIHNLNNQNNNNQNNNQNNNNQNNNNSSSTVAVKPFFQFSSTRSLKYPNILFFRYFSFLVQEFDLNIDESSVLNALSFININLNSLNQHFKLHPTITQEEILQSATDNSKLENMVYFEMLHINPLKVNLSFTSSKLPKEISAVLGARSLSELLLGIKSSSPFLNIEHAPIKFNGFIWEHPFLSIKQVTDEITLHFSYQMMGQIHKIFGSFDAIGNPIRLAESLGSGFKDFFHEPAMGIVKSPQDFALGVSKGTSSLVNNSVFGIMDSASKITGTIGKGLVHLSLDDQYIRERQESNKVKPTGLKQGLEFGIRDLGEGLLRGITGIIDEPIKGATQEKSIEGFLKGVGKGVIGVAVKPTVGLFEFASRTSEGVKNSTTIAKSLMNNNRRRRLPRYFSKDGTLQLYNNFKAQGAYLLYSKFGAPPLHSWYQFHVLLSRDHVLLASTNQIVLLAKSSSASGQAPSDYEIGWTIKINDIQQFFKQQGTNVIAIVYQGSSKLPPTTVTIPTPNEEVKMSILRKISELVNLSKRFGTI
ncbi:hypothetical protein DFA_05918 [Cavenderia fasciculata]|uniref:Vacuolar protein sorting-associated protein 13 family protein n=1 Tax=Cavenderia fasciculata TaxID=261658 RepID=F4PJK8_CACFS|nr:uncharacterized protein DFA_05918 [Cavenderia fasciculata]EGG23782.1 hypothetical protein DFA_05918 [Cavenderia fasciculata]|eukprot:XP_004361633.1 hypothetical protein DFA_05918 [Cavenderia fasciculata]